MGFSDHQRLNELEWAARAAREFGAEHQVVTIDATALEESLDAVVHTQDEPLADWVCLPLYHVAKLAAGAVRVVLVGEGADEQFCGYAGYLDYLRIYQRYWMPFRRLLPGALGRGAAALARGVGRGVPRWQVAADFATRAARNGSCFWGGATVFWEEQKRSLVDRQRLAACSAPLPPLGGLSDPRLGELDSGAVIGLYRERLGSAPFPTDELARMSDLEFQLRLPELLLMRVDKMTMAHSLEARVPFLDQRLVEWSLGIPMGDKIPGLNPKHLLKRAVADWIPAEIIARPKMGFGAPMREWLLGAFGHRAEAEIASSPLMRRGFFHMGEIHRRFALHRSGAGDQSHYLWTIYNLVAWHDTWIERRSG